MENEKEISKKVFTSVLKNDLKSGLTRWEKDNLGFGSIEKKYNLTFTEMKQVIEHPRLRGIKTKIPTLLIIDDILDKDINNEEEKEESKEEIKEITRIEISDLGKMNKEIIKNEINKKQENKIKAFI